MLVQALCVVFCLSGITAAKADEQWHDKIGGHVKELTLEKALMFSFHASQKDTETLITALAENDRLDAVCDLLDKVSKTTSSIQNRVFVLRLLQEHGDAKLLPRMLALWHESATFLFIESEGVQGYYIYQEELLFTIATLSKQLYPQNVTNLKHSPFERSEEAKEIIDEATSWWAENAYLYGMEPLATYGEDALIPTPFPLVNAKPRTQHRKSRPTAAAIELPPRLGTLWLIAIAACGAITAAVIDLRRKRNGT